MPRLLLTLAPLLSACGAAASDAVCPVGPAQPGCNSQLSQRGCEAEGGCWGVWGADEAASCNCPTSDEGLACTADADCQGACVAPLEACGVATAGTCSGLSEVYGCFCSPSTAGDWQTRCLE